MSAICCTLCTRPFSPYHDEFTAFITAEASDMSDSTRRPIASRLTSSSASISVSRAPRFSSVKRRSSSISQYQSEDSSVSARKRFSMKGIIPFTMSVSACS